MPIVTGPLFSISAKGIIGKAIGYVTSNGKNICRKAPEKIRAISKLQKEQRGKYSEAINAWNDLSEEQKVYWNEQVKGMQMTGMNLYMSSYLMGKIKKSMPANYGVGRYGIDYYRGVT